MLEKNWFFKILLIFVFSLLLLPLPHNQNLSHLSTTKTTKPQHQQNRLIDLSTLHLFVIHVVATLCVRSKCKLENTPKTTRKYANTKLVNNLKLLSSNCYRNNLSPIASPIALLVTRPSSNISTCNSFSKFKTKNNYIIAIFGKKPSKPKKKTKNRCATNMILYVYVCVLCLWPVNRRCHLFGARRFRIHSHKHLVRGF